MKLVELMSLNEARAPTQWSAINVIRNILGPNFVSVDPHNVAAGQYLVKQGAEPTFTPPVAGKVEPWMAELGLTAQNFPGTIEIPNANSMDAADVAQAAHEAYHAWMTVKSKGTIWRNEKFTNQLATKWLKKNLSGVELHVALETILKSKIEYGHN